MAKCNQVHMSIGDALDKYTILLLKQKYGEEDKLDGKRWDGQEIDMETISVEITELEAEIERYMGYNLEIFRPLIKMAQANAAIWQAERALRSNDLQSVDLTRAGLESIRIRQENSVRTRNKKQIDQVI